MTIIDIRSQTNLENTNVFIDTNILLFVDGIISQEEKSKIYSKKYFELKKKNRFFTTEKCLDEFNNRLTKYYYEMDKNGDSQIESFKKYRKSEKFADTMACIYSATESFLDELEVISDYRFMDCKSAFKNIETGLIDYADVVSARLCLKEDFYIFTDDADLFYCRELKIITANNWMVQNSPKRERLARL